VCCWQKKDADVQTSLEEIDIHLQLKQQCTASSMGHTAGLPERTAEPDHQYHIHPRLDVQTLGVSDSLGVIVPESGRNQTLFHGVAKDHGCPERDHGHYVLLPETVPHARSVSSRADCGVGFDEDGNAAQPGSVSSRIDPGVGLGKDGNGAESDLPLSTRSVLKDQSSGVPKPSEVSVAQQDGDREKKLPSLEARVPSQSVGRDRELSVNSQSRLQAKTDDNVISSRFASCNGVPAADSCTTIPAFTNSENKVPFSRGKVPSRSARCNRGPTFDISDRVPSDSNDVNKVLSSRTRVPFQAASYDGEPSVSNRSRVPAESDDNGTASRNQHSNRQRRSRGESCKGDRTSSNADHHQQLVVSENLEADLTGTSVWSETSPQHCQSRFQSIRVRTSLLTILTSTGWSRNRRQFLIPQCPHMSKTPKTVCTISDNEKSVKSSSFINLLIYVFCGEFCFSVFS